jgi:hypothetical protein
MTLDDGLVDAFRLAAAELLAQPRLRFHGLGEYDEARRLLVDPMHDEGQMLAV